MAGRKRLPRALATWGSETIGAQFDGKEFNLANSPTCPATGRPCTC